MLYSPTVHNFAAISLKYASGHYMNYLEHTVSTETVLYLMKKHISPLYCVYDRTGMVYSLNHPQLVRNYSLPKSHIKNRKHKG